MGVGGDMDERLEIGMMTTEVGDQRRSRSLCP